MEEKQKKTARRLFVLGKKKSPMEHKHNQ